MNLVGDSSNPNVPAVSAVHSTNGRGVAASSAHGIALEATATNDTAVFAHSDTGRGVDASSAQFIALEATATNNTAIFAHSNTGLGVDARSTNNTAVIAQSNTGRGVDARSAQSIALEATATNDTAVFAHSNTGRGVDARSAQFIALEATATNDTAVFAHSDTGRGVDGRSNSNEGVHGESNSSAPGVVGFNTAPPPNGDGVFGTCLSNEGSGNAIHGRGGNNAGFFEGDVTVKAFGISTGNITADGSISAAAKPFVIDHPCDPENKFLYHCSVESPEMMNVYSGSVTTDARGEACVSLPSYFDALNYDFRYQLTAIGQFCQAIIAKEIANNRFIIKTDKPNVRVSWQVSGVRKDVYAKAHPIVVEREKSAAEKGFYLHPRLFGQPAYKGLSRSPRGVRDQVTVNEH